MTATTRVVSIDAESGATDDVAQAIRDVGGTVQTRIEHQRDDDPTTPEYVQLEASLTDEQADEIEALDSVRYVELDEGYALTSTTDDEDWHVEELDASAQGETIPWNLKRLGIPEAWERTRGGNVPIAIIDSGADDDHPDLAPNIQHGKAYVECDGSTDNACNESWSDDQSHGSHVQGTAAGADTGEGVTGVAPDALVRVFKTLNSDGRTSWTNMARAITDAAAGGAKVLSMSIGGSSGSRTLRDACAFAAKRATLVAAAGNDGADSVSYPAKYPMVLCAGATNHDDEVASFSNRGDVDFAGPGVDILSSVPPGKYARFRGTSMWTPALAAIVVLCYDAGATREEIPGLLRETAEDLGEPPEAQGAGMPDVNAALDRLAADGGEKPNSWDPDLNVPWPPDNNDSDTTMKDLQIDGNGKDAGPAWYFFDVTGDAEAGPTADKQEAIKQSARNSDHTRISGKLLGGVDDFRYSGEIAYFHITGAWAGTTITDDGETLAPADLPGFDRDAPPESDDPFPDGLPDGGYQVGESNGEIVVPMPGARNRDRAALQTTQDVYLYVHPDGDDSAAGSKQEPLASINEAARRFPLLVVHELQVLVAPGEYQNPSNGGLTIGPIVQGYFDHSRKGIDIMGLGDSPEETTFSGCRQFNVDYWGNGSYQQGRFRNCTINATVCGRQGSGWGLQDVVVNPTRSDGVAVSGYGTTMFLQGVEFGSRTKHAVKCKEGSEFILNQCTGQASEGVVDGSAGQVRAIWSNSIEHPGESWGAKLNPNVPITIQRGLVEQ